MTPTIAAITALVSFSAFQALSVPDVLPLIPAAVSFAESDARKFAHDSAEGPLLVDIQSIQSALLLPAGELVADSIIKRMIDRPFRSMRRDQAVITEAPNRYRMLDDGVLVEINAIVLTPIRGIAYVYVTSTTQCGSAMCPRQWRLTFRAGGPTKWTPLKNENLFAS